MSNRKTALKRNTDETFATTTLVDVGIVIDLAGPELSMDPIEDTPYGEDSDYRSYSAGLKDGGELTATVRYQATDTQADALEAAFHAGTRQQVALVFPAPMSKQWLLTVLVTKLGIPISEKGGKISRAFTFKVSGKPDITAVS